MTDSRINFSRNLQYLLETKRVTKKDFCDKTGISRPSLDGYIKTTVDPGLTAISKAAEFFSVSVEDILSEAMHSTPGRLMVAGLPNQKPHPNPSGDQAVSPALIAQIAREVLKESASVGLSDVRRDLVNLITTSPLHDAQLEAVFKGIRGTIAGKLPSRNKGKSVG